MVVTVGNGQRRGSDELIRGPVELGQHRPGIGGFLLGLAERVAGYKLEQFVDVISKLQKSLATPRGHQFWRRKAGFNQVFLNPVGEADAIRMSANQ